jgi:hypothetical protein
MWWTYWSQRGSSACCKASAFGSGETLTSAGRKQASLVDDVYRTGSGSLPVKSRKLRIRPSHLSRLLPMGNVATGGDDFDRGLRRDQALHVLGMGCGRILVLVTVHDQGRTVNRSELAVQ